MLIRCNESVPKLVGSILIGQRKLFVLGQHGNDID